jgi:tRNA(Arg) A34 adenosine deaminase TadA
MRRRSTLKKLLALAAGALGGRAAAQAPAPAGSREALMEQAFAMRQRAIDSGDQPYGAVVAKDGRVVGEGVSAVRTASDPTAHAEMVAIRDATRRLGTSDLSGCELYGTSRACPMCEAAAARARISRMYHGAPVVDDGAPASRG